VEDEKTFISQVRITSGKGCGIMNPIFDGLTDNTHEHSSYSLSAVFRPACICRSQIPQLDVERLTQRLLVSYWLNFYKIKDFLK